MKNILFTLFALAGSALLAQKPDFVPAEWVNRLSGHYTQGINGIALAPNDDISFIGGGENRGNVHYYSGKKFIDSSGFQPIQHKNPSRMLIGRYDSTGKLLWHLESSGTGSLHAWAITHDPEGNILVTGNYQGEVRLNEMGGSGMPMPVSTYTDASIKIPVYCSFVAKYSPTGKLLWARSGMSKDHSAMMDVRCDREGNVYVKAYAHANSIAFDRHTLLTGSGADYTYNYSIILLKYTPEGREEWVFYGGSANARFFDIDSSGNPVMTVFHQERFKLWNTNSKAYTIPSHGPELRYTLLYIDRNDGSLLRYDSLHFDLKDASIHQIKAAPGGGHFCLTMAYPTESYGRRFKLQAGGKKYLTNWYDYFLIRYDAKGKLRWLARVSGDNDDRPLDLHVDSEGNCILAGWITASAVLYDANGDSVRVSGRYRSLWICALDSLGKLRWHTRAGGWTHHQEHPRCDLLLNSHGKLQFYVNYNAPTLYGKDSLVPYGKEAWYSRRHDSTFVAYEGIDAAILSVAPKDRIQRQKRDSMPVLALLNDSLHLAGNSQRFPADTVSEFSGLSDSMRSAGIIPRLSTDTVRKPVNPIVQAAASAVQLRLFPIPVSRSEARLHLHLQISPGVAVQWTVQDANGKELQRNNETPADGKLERTLDISTWAPGTYYFRFFFQGRQELRKVMIL